MSDEIGRAIERIGARFSLDGNDLESVKRAHVRLRRRRRIASVIVAFVLVGSGTLAAAAVIDDPSDCAVPKDYPLDATVNPQAGTIGTNVVVTGPVPFYEQDGTFDASEIIEVWWNADPETYWDLLNGSEALAVNPNSPVQRLGEQPANEACDFKITFTVPDVPEGKYNVVIIHGQAGGVALYDLGHTFEVIGDGQ